MDVRFSNVVEVTRQYFQGVPPGVGSGPPPGQAPAQRPPSYWTTGASQAVYPPVSSAPSPLPYPNQQQHQRLPSMGAFTSGQQRSSSTLPSMSQVKHSTPVQDYPSGYSGRIPSGYKFSAEQQQAGAALYNPAVSPSMQAAHRHNVSPRTQSSHSQSSAKVGTPSSNPQSASQSYHISQQQNSQPSYHIPSRHLTSHQLLTEAAQQLSLLQASQSNHLSSVSQSQISHPRQSPLHSSHQLYSSVQHSSSHAQHQQQSSSHSQLQQSSSGQDLRSPITQQSSVQHHQSSRHQSSLHHSQQHHSGVNHPQLNIKQMTHLQQQASSHRQQGTSQSSDHRMLSSSSSLSGHNSHYLSNSHISSQLGQQLLQQGLQTSSHSHKNQSLHQSFSQPSAQQLSHQLLNQLQPLHQSVNQQSHPSIQSSYQQQLQVPSSSHHSTPIANHHRLPSPSSHLQASISLASQSQHHYNTVPQQQRSSHSNNVTYSSSSGSRQGSYMTPSTAQSSVSQTQLSTATSRLISHLGSSGSASNLAAMSHSLGHSRESLNAGNHSSLPNLSGNAIVARESAHGSSHVNMANLVNNSIREGMKTNLPSIANLMSVAHLHESHLLNSRASILNQASPVSSRKLTQNQHSGSGGMLNATNEPSGANISDMQGRSLMSMTSPSPSHPTPNASTTPSHRSIVSGVVKRESPLDLSVKTVRQSADSTAADEEYLNFVYNHSPDYYQRQTPPKSSFPNSPSLYETSRNTNKPVSAPKVDFTPDFSSSAHLLPKKKKTGEAQQQNINNLPSIGSFAKPQLPRSRADSYSYYQSGPSTSSVASFPHGQQAYIDIQKSSSSAYAPLKRPSDEPPPAAHPTKIPRTDDTWRQTIDRQIENKLNSYLSSKTVNGDRPNDVLPPQNFRPQSIYPQFQQQMCKTPEKALINGQADKRVLNILRTSLETREAKKASPAPPPPVERSQKIPVVTPPPLRQNLQNLPPFGAIGTYPKEVQPLETKPVEIVDISDDNEESDLKKPTTNGNASSGELDGLAAFLAARIRTKAELKQQVDPGGPVRFGSPSNIASPSYNQNVSTPTRGLKTEVVDTDSSASQTPVLVQAASVSPPKLTKENGTTLSIPRKRDSDSDCDAPPVLERQRKSLAQQQAELITHVPLPGPLPDPPTPPFVKEEDLPEEEKEWLKKCDQLIDQLRACPLSSSKKKRYKKRRLKIKPITKEEPRDGGMVPIKAEPITPTEHTVLIKQEPGEDFEGDNILERTSLPLPENNQDLEDAGSSASELGEAEVPWQRRGNTIVRRKKPLGDGSHFVPGWQDEVYRYKQSLRMPDSLISIARPTSSLPDLQNYMDSPAGGDSTPESTPVKQNQADTLAQSLNQEKTILDKLMERFKLNRTEPEAHDAKNPYMDYLNKERRKARGRSQSRKFIKKKATFKEIFGEERPASAPPAGVREGERKKPSRHTKVILRNIIKLRSKRNLRDRQPTAFAKPKKRRGPRPKSERHSQVDATAMVQSEKSNETKKVKTIKRKGKSSGFDYIKKKKKINKEQNLMKGERKRKKKKCVPMTEDEIKEELKTWILNKDSGETNLQRAARLGYTEVVLYCLSKLKEKATCKDLAGFTPLHEAASQGHIDIAKLLLDSGANVNEPAQGGIRPLHEAAENGFTDLMEVLLRFGADPELATCNGQTALSLATDQRARNIIEQYRAKPDEVPPSSTVLPPPPIITPDTAFEAEDDGDVIDGFEIEESDILLPSLYRLNGEPRSSSWILFHELAPLVRAKTKDSLLRRLGVTRQDVRDLRPSDFYARARTRTLTMGDNERKPPKLATKMSRVTLVRYTQAVRLLLGVETTVIPR